MSRFGPHHGASGKLHWVRPGLMVAAAVTQQGSLEVCKCPVAHVMQHFDGVHEPGMIIASSTSTERDLSDGAQRCDQLCVRT